MDWTVWPTLVVLLLGGLVIGQRWWRWGRDDADILQGQVGVSGSKASLLDPESVAVEFSPPQQLTPALLGLILDKKVGGRAMTATIVNLAVRGYLTITETADAKDWVLEQKTSSREGLLAYESILMNGLFPGSERTQVKLSELSGALAGVLPAAERAVYTDTRARQWFTQQPDQVIGFWAVRGGLLIAVALLYLHNLVGLALGLVGAADILTGKFMVARTAVGREMLERMLGFKLYIETAEKGRSQAAAQSGAWTQALPYAIAFGCVSMWAKAMASENAAASVSWYAGSGLFAAGMIPDRMQALEAKVSGASQLTPTWN